MKKSIIIAAVAALALVSCHQPTKEEQQMQTIKQAVDKHINANFEYPKGYEVTDVKIDTVTTNHKCARYVHEWTDSLTMDNIASQLMFAVLPEKTQKRMERYAELQMFDTLQPDVAYISAKATVRHRCDKDGNKCVCSVYVFMRNEDVVVVEDSDSKTKFQSVLDKWQPAEIQNVIKAMSEMAETWSFLN